MAKKQWILLAVFLLLTATYVFVFTNCGRRPIIQISHAAYSRAMNVVPKRMKAARPTTALVRFNLDHSYPLNEIKVVRLANWQTNPSTLPLWHLVSDSNSIPTRRFFYGVAIRGMKSVMNIRPEPLETNTVYRLFLTSGSLKGQHDFSAPPP